METKEKIKQLFVDSLRIKPEQLKDDVKLSDGIGVDSTEMVEMVIAIEKAFGIKLAQKDVTKFSTINEIDGVVKSKIGK